MPAQHRLTRLWLPAKEHLELVSQDQIPSTRSWRERQQATRTRSSIKRKRGTGRGAYQGTTRQRVHDPARLLPPFSLEQIGPMTAGLAIQATTGLKILPISPWAGLGVLTAWAVGTLTVGGLLLWLRDA